MTKWIFFLLFQKTPVYFLSDDTFEKWTSLIDSEHLFLDLANFYGYFASSTKTKGESLNFLDYIYFCRLDIVQILSILLPYISISEKWKFFISWLNKFYFLFVHYFIVRNKSKKKSSDTSGKPKARLGIFDEQDKKSLLFRHKKRNFLHPFLVSKTRKTNNAS